MGHVGTIYLSGKSKSSTPIPARAAELVSDAFSPQSSMSLSLITEQYRCTALAYGDSSVVEAQYPNRVSLNS